MYYLYSSSWLLHVRFLLVLRQAHRALLQVHSRHVFAVATLFV